jgi:hypothetical protein
MAKKALGAGVPSDALPQIVFKGDFQLDVNGEIKSGSEVAILFDAERLPVERSLDEKGKPAWTISAFYRFSPSTEVASIDLASEKNGSSKKEKAGEKTFLKGIFTVPSGSEEAVIWFRGTGSAGDEYYDSDYGKNYRFPVSPAAAEPEIVEEAPLKKRRTKKA